MNQQLQTSKLCVSMLKEMGAEVTIFNIDTACPSRSNNGNPKPIVCRFVRCLAKESVMNHCKDACKVMQTVLFETKKFKDHHNYQFCWSKGSIVYVQQDATSIMVSR